MTKNAVKGTRLTVFKLNRPNVKTVSNWGQNASRENLSKFAKSWAMTRRKIAARKITQVSVSKAYHSNAKIASN